MIPSAGWSSSEAVSAKGGLGADVVEPCPAQTRATVFGLDVESEIALPFLEGSAAKPTGRRLTVSAQDTAAASSEWPPSSELICDERQPGGRSIYRIERHPTAGYLIAGPEYGTFVLTADGRRLVCSTKGIADAAWQRLLVAQVLPFAALLQGLEVFHASAVVHAASAVAFLGPSRSGKTSLALELCARGASFLTDDVLVLERDGDDLVAHPGTPLAVVDREPARDVDDGAHGGAGEIMPAGDGKRPMPIQNTQATPLGALFFIDSRRDEKQGAPRFEPAGDAQTLLSATFNFVLVAPQRLLGLLDVCSRAARLRVERIYSGATTNTTELAIAVERRLDSLA